MTNTCENISGVYLTKNEINSEFKAILIFNKEFFDSVYSLLKIHNYEIYREENVIYNFRFAQIDTYHIGIMKITPKELKEFVNLANELFANE